MVMRRVFVLWSGGLDSTFLIEQLLADPTVDAVMAGYVYLSNQSAKAESELQAIRRMAPVLRARDDRFVWLGVLLDVEFYQPNRTLTWKQVPPWLLAAIEAVHVEVEQVAIGYIKNSHPPPEGEADVTAHVADIERIYAAYQPLMSRPMPRLVFPLLHTSKSEVMARITPEMAALCVHCEAPIRTASPDADGDASFRPCGRCPTCLVHGAGAAPIDKKP